MEATVTIAWLEQNEAENCLLTLKQRGYRVSDNINFTISIPTYYIVAVECDKTEQKQLKKEFNSRVCVWE